MHAGMFFSPFAVQTLGFVLLLRASFRWFSFLFSVALASLAKFVTRGAHRGHGELRQNLPEATGAAHTVHSHLPPNNYSTCGQP